MVRKSEFWVEDILVLRSPIVISNGHGTSERPGTVGYKSSNLHQFNSSSPITELPCISLTVLTMSVKGHVVALELPFWGKIVLIINVKMWYHIECVLIGHIKPLCALLSRLLRVKPAYVTFFSAAIMRDQIIAEFDRLFIDAGAAELKSLVR